VKSPAELVVGTVRMAQGLSGPQVGYQSVADECTYQGQELLNPPSVESWHTGEEWIDGGALVRRVNFAAKYFSNTDLEGIRTIIDYIKARGTLSPNEFLDSCLELMGPIELGNSTYQELLKHITEDGDLSWDSSPDTSESERRIGILLAMVSASREYQFA